MVTEINKVSNFNRTDCQSDTRLKNINAYPSYGIDFDSMLKEQLNKSEGIQFSKHAKERALQRGIEINGTLLDSLNNAVEKARAKGIKDVVIIGKQEAFIINTTKNIVVTTITGQEMQNNVFTNIDGAVIL